MNCIIVDDEPLAIELMEDYVSKVPFLNLVSSTSSAFEAVELLSSSQVDLVFLDIQMPELTGIELLKSLSQSPGVIFTTAYPDYALEGYEMDAIDYLVKPFPFERFFKAVNKAKRRLKPVLASPSSVSEESSDPGFIFVKSEYKTVKVRFQDIHYIESMKDYITFHLEDEKITSLNSMSKVEKALPSSFFRIHRSYIIALDKIEEIERNTLMVKGDRLTVGTNYRDVFKDMIDQNRLR